MDFAIKVVLAVLAVAALWLVVELALTVRRARPVLDSVKKTVDDVKPVVEQVGTLVEQARPVVQQVAEVVDAARPGVAQLDPVLTQTTQAIGALTGDLERLDTILGDVSRISKSAGNATVAVGDAAGTLASKARVLFAKGRTAVAAVPAAGGSSADVPAVPEVASRTTEEQSPERDFPAEQPAPAVVDQEAGYFTYPSSQS